MKPPEVVICVEHVARELSLSTLLRGVAQRQEDMRIEVRSLLESPSQWPADWKPRVICVPYAYSANDFGLRELIAAHPQAQIVNLAYEQHLSRANEQFKCPRDEFTRRRVIHLASGDQFANYLSKHGVPSEQIIRLGNLPCTLYQTPYRNRFEGRRQMLADRHGLRADSPWVLVPENFAAAFFRRSHIRQRLKQGFPRQELNEYVQSARQCFAEAINWLAGLAASRRCEVIVRPRPAVNEAYFRQQVGALLGSRLPEGMHIVKSGDVRDWVCASDAVVSNISSTLVEAAAAGKPIAMLQPRPLPRSVEAAWNEHAPLACMVDDLNRLVDHIIASRRDASGAEPLRGSLDQSAIQAWVAQEMLGRGDAVLGCLQVLRRLLANTETLTAGATADADMMPAPVAQSQPTWRQLGKRIGKLMPRLRPAAFGHEQDGLTPEIVQADATAWEDVLSHPTNRRHTQVDEKAA